VSKAKSANSLYRKGEYAAATAAYAVALQIAAEAPEACADQDLPHSTPNPNPTNPQP
jgi:hypothetical protein